MRIIIFLIIFFFTLSYTYPHAGKIDKHINDYKKSMPDYFQKSIIKKEPISNNNLMINTNDDVFNYFCTPNARTLKFIEKTRAKMIFIQSGLKILGYYNSKIDGIYSIDTYNAIVSYQTNRGLEKTGRINAETRKKFLSDINKSKIW